MLIVWLFKYSKDATEVATEAEVTLPSGVSRTCLLLGPYRDRASTVLTDTLKASNYCLAAMSRSRGKLKAEQLSDSRDSSTRRCQFASLSLHRGVHFCFWNTRSRPFARLLFSFRKTEEDSRNYKRRNASSLTKHHNVMPTPLRSHKEGRSCATACGRSSDCRYFLTFLKIVRSTGLSHSSSVFVALGPSSTEKSTAAV